MTAPRVSIIIAAYNAAGTIAETLSSIPLSLSVPYEVIVIDDGSKDDTAAVAQAAMPGITLIKQPNTGVSAARNAGLDKAVGDYVFFLDGDDLVFPGALDKLMTALDADPKAVLAYGDYVNINARGDEIGHRRLLNLMPRPSGDCLQAILQINFIVIGAAIVRRSLLGDSRFNTRMGFGEDAEFWCRVALLGPFVHVRTPIMKYRRHNASATATRSDITEGAEERLSIVLGNPALKQRLSPATLARIHSVRRSHIYILHAIRETRLKNWKAALHCYGRAIKTCPQRFVPMTLRFILTSLKVI